MVIPPGWRREARSGVFVSEKKRTGLIRDAPPASRRGMDTIKLGNRIRDRVTGQEGIATARLQYLNGCVQFCLQPPVDKEGKRPDAIYIDAQQLEVIGDGIAVTARETGGPAGSAPTSYRG